MTIVETEAKLMAEWFERNESRQCSGAYKGFITDGIVDEKSFFSQAQRVVFVLKEVNDKTRGTWLLKDFFRKCDYWRTWNNVTRWTIGLRRLKKDCTWKELPKVDQQCRIDTIRTICVMNLKKWPGTSQTIRKELMHAVEIDGDLIKRQFCLYDSELKGDRISICGGADVSSGLAKALDIDLPADWPRTKRGVSFIEWRPRSFIIDYAHPQYWGKSNQLHYDGLIDACREILQDR